MAPYVIDKASDAYKTALEECRRNPLKDTMEAGTLAYSYGLQFTFNAEIALMAKKAGFQALLMNLEHTRTGLETMSTLACACLNVGITPMIVAPTLSSEWISRALDVGCQAVVVPRVNNAEMARDIVKYSKYRPLGERPLAETPAQQYMENMPFREVMEVTNDRVLAMPMIETVEGLENIEAIAAVPGIDVLHVGTFDLMDDMGIVGEFDNPRLMAAYERICAAAEANSVNGRRVFVGAGGLEPRPDILKHLGKKFPCMRFVFGAREQAVMMNGLRTSARALKAMGESFHE
ncbi:hypothetical protein MNV49_007677 [Pseudohyphozyma bogoriensis]|nr:hypothetical protein MNV49_007677 [Pseudohyphozyma bogoriensis]